MNKYFGIIFFFASQLFAADVEKISCIDQLIGNNDWPSGEISPCVIANTNCARLGRLSSKGIVIPYEKLVRLRSKKLSRNEFWNQKLKEGKIFYYIDDKDPDKHPVFIIAIESSEMNKAKTCRANFAKRILEPYGIETREAYGILIHDNKTLAIFKVASVSNDIVEHPALTAIDNCVVEKNEPDTPRLYANAATDKIPYQQPPFTYIFPSWSSTKNHKMPGTLIGGAISDSTKRKSSYQESDQTLKKSRVETGPLDEATEEKLVLYKCVEDYLFLDYPSSY